MARDLPEEPLHRLRLLRGGRSPRARAEAATGARQRRASRSATSRTSARTDDVRPHHRLRRDPRPGAARRRCWRGIADALRPDGVFLMQDIAGSSHVHDNLEHPLGPFIYTISSMHCMTVSLALGGAGLGAMWGEEKATRDARARPASPTSRSSNSRTTSSTTTTSPARARTPGGRRPLKDGAAPEGWATGEERHDYRRVASRRRGRRGSACVRARAGPRARAHAGGVAGDPARPRLRGGAAGDLRLRRLRDRHSSWPTS